MHPLSPSHQTWFAAYETYLRQKTLVDASRKRLLRLARRYLHYLDTEYPGIEATCISLTCAGFCNFWKSSMGRKSSHTNYGARRQKSTCHGVCHSI